MAPPAPDRTLYVGNLPYDCSQEEVEQLIGGTGAGAGARINLPIDADGRKRGFGFVTMETADAARVAMEALKGAEIRGRRLVINIAHPKGERPARPDGPGGGPMRSGPRPGGPGPGFGPPRGPSGFGGGMAPPLDQPRRTFDERRRSGGGGGGEEGAPGGKRRGGGGGGGRVDRDRGRRADDWTDYDTDDDD
jgi:RNA recognition motif-containing protein